MTGIHWVTLPKWGLSMTEGTIVQWLVHPGAQVSDRDELVEVETAKVNAVVEAAASGQVRRLLAAAGSTVAVGGLLAVIADPAIDEAAIDEAIAAFQPPRDTESGDVGEGGQEMPSVVVDGYRISYAAMGPGGEDATGPSISASPVVFIHGFGGNLANWLFTQSAASTTLRTYALDLPGHGAAEVPRRGLSLADFAAIVRGFADSLELRTMHLVGHSVGGAIALAIAETIPTRVKSLTLLCSTGLGAEINREFIDGLASASTRKSILPVLSLLFADPGMVTRQLVEDVLSYKRMDGVTEFLTETAERLFAGRLQRDDLRSILASLTDADIPVTVLAGEKDRVIPAAHISGLPSRVRAEVLPGVGHMPHLEHPAMVNAAIPARGADPKSPEWRTPHQ